MVLTAGGNPLPAAAPAAAIPLRFEALDSWRGICACIVALFHFPGYSPLYWAPFIRNAYLFVDFFFVLSGFVIAWNYESRLGTRREVRDFLVLRLGRLYPLHLFTLLLFVAVEAAHYVGSAGPAAQEAAFAGDKPWAIVTNLLLVQSLNLHHGQTWNGPSWSISTELWTYVVFALLCLAGRLRRWLLAVAAVLLPVALVVLSKSGMDITYDYGLLRCMYGFGIGALCCHLHRARLRRGIRRGTAFMTMQECLVVATAVAFVAAAGTGRLSLLAPYVFGLVVLTFAVEGGWASRVLQWPMFQWLGRISYSIYMTHFVCLMLFIGPGLDLVSRHLFHVDLWTQLPLPAGGVATVLGRSSVEGNLLYAGMLALTLAFSAFTYRIVEMPGRAWTRRWVRRQQLPASAALAV